MEARTALASPGVPQCLFPYDQEDCAPLGPEEGIQIVEARLQGGGERRIRGEPVQDGLYRVPDEEEIQDFNP